MNKNIELNPKNRKSRKTAITLSALLIMSIFTVTLAGLPLVDATEILDIQPSWILDATGTYFEITESPFQNLTVESSESIHLSIESAQIITIWIESESEAESTEITISNLTPETTYHKYEDNYHNHVAFTTDLLGHYEYVQDISAQHLIIIQLTPSTIFVSDNGWSDPSIGSWDPITRTATLTQDVTETIQIDSDDITLNGNYHSIAGSSRGINCYRINNVTIKNTEINSVYEYAPGIVLNYCNDVTLESNSISNANVGIQVNYSTNSSILNNNIFSNSYKGIAIYQSKNNIVEGNSISETSGHVSTAWIRDIEIDRSENNTLANNTIISDEKAITISRSNYNNLTANVIHLLSGNGITLSYSNSNIIEKNTIDQEGGWRIVVGASENNQIVENLLVNKLGITFTGGSRFNNFTKNTLQSNSWAAYFNGESNENLFINNNIIDCANSNPVETSADSSGNIFSLPKPIGGNYWSNWNSPDNNNDGFVDNPYLFNFGQDQLPWAKPDGWLDTTPPETTIALNPSDPTGNNNWYVNPVTVTISTLDNMGGSGVKELHYIINSEPEITTISTTTIQIETEGYHTVEAWAIDNNGNIESPHKIANFKIDQTAPTIEIQSPKEYEIYSTDSSEVYNFNIADNYDSNPTISATVTDIQGTIIPITQGQQLPTISGVYELNITAIDQAGLFTSSTVMFVVYDPSAGFVTGGGWIDSPQGAYTIDQSLNGKATFGFVSKYKNGATVPTGQTQFIFNVANLNFHSSSYDWLVISGYKAQYKGTGTINGEGEYGFMLTAVDGEIKGDGIDTFRVKIWDKTTDTLVYDNQIGFSDGADPTTAIGGGSIIIHK